MLKVKGRSTVEAARPQELPVVFDDSDVVAILDGRKTVTRRVIDRVLGIGMVTEFQPSSTRGYDWTMRDRKMLWNDLSNTQLLLRCPFGTPGTRLWVREAYAARSDVDSKAKPGKARHYAMYRADKKGDPHDFMRWHDYGRGWRPAAQMPRELARTLLEVTDVRVERLNQITDADARREGVIARGYMNHFSSVTDPESAVSQRPWNHARDAFREIWNARNTKRPEWLWPKNTWVWVVSFTVAPSEPDGDA